MAATGVLRLREADHPSLVPLDYDWSRSPLCRCTTHRNICDGVIHHGHYLVDTV